MSLFSIVLSIQLGWIFQSVLFIPWFSVSLDAKRLCLYLLLDIRYLDVLGRHNYATPTSYLELISSFKTLLGKKQDEVLAMLL